MYESCPLARHFAEQGLKIRIRKEPRKRNSKQRQKLKQQVGNEGTADEETSTISCRRSVSWYRLFTL